jgi:hypothetical protein
MSKDLTKEFAKLPIEKKDIIFGAAYDYDLLNQQEKLLKERREKQCRPVVETAADTWGIPDAEGHLHLNFTGKLDDEDVDVEIVRQKKVSRILNSVAAEQMLKDKGLYEACVTPIVSYEIDEEKIIEAYEAGKISARELDSIFTEKVNYATIVHVDAEEIKNIEQARKALAKGLTKGEMPEIENN